jgi:hypothetical protein
MLSINNAFVIFFWNRVHVSQMFKNSHDKTFKPSDVVSVGDNVIIMFATSPQSHLDCL